jgi:hypothetical protein
MDCSKGYVGRAGRLRQLQHSHIVNKKRECAACPVDSQLRPYIVVIETEHSCECAAVYQSNTSA